MKHIFDVEIAKEYGVNAAIILENINFWIQKNEANEVNFFDGNYWTYNSGKAMEALFPYLTSKQIRTAVDTLVKAGLVVVGNYNENPMNHTKWYALTKKGKSICLRGQMLDSPFSDNRFAPEGKSSYYTDINITDINSDINMGIDLPSQANRTPKKAKEPDPLETLTGSADLRQVVEDWLTYKREKRQAYKPTGLKTFIRQVNAKAGEFGEAAVIDLIADSMANGYQGVTWDRLRKRQEQQRPVYQPQKEDNPFTRLREKYEREERMAAGIEEYLEVEEND